MEMDSQESGGLSLLRSDKVRSGSLELRSPLFSKDHSISVSYFGGRPYAVRGKVNVKEDGSHKTITEIDFDSSFEVLNIFSNLYPANRDTFIFAHDEIPDTLRASTNYRSFYSPVTILKEKPSNNSINVLPKDKETIKGSDTTLVVPKDTLIVEPNVELPALLDSTISTNKALIDSTK
tara:strand:+ start:24 stop:557 length:534 start_codon:yes stop_codon:yes gene_type:complete